jgi:UDP-N-acetylmuramyl pentapeptide phosphotransferase/UDP-N-acetylglucosamine-1-phosphate transferase
MLELSYLLGSFLVGLLILLKMKNSIYKYLILFVICILVVPTVLLIAAIRRVEYRKEFQEILKNKDTEFYVEKCTLSDRKILIDELIKVKPFVGNRKAPNSPLEVRIENSKKK